MHARNGYTATEMMMTLGVLSVLVASVTPMLIGARRGFTKNEARTAMVGGAQRTLNGIARKLISCKRLFEASAEDSTYLAALDLSGEPAVLAGSALPAKEAGGALSPSTSSFVAASVGNALFFAAYEPAAEYVVAGTGGSTATVRIDVYRFHYYYLTEDAATAIAKAPRRVLRAWHSGVYADYRQLAAITDTVKRANAASALASGGVVRAFDAAAAFAGNAFYHLGGLTSDAGHQIVKDSSQEALRLLTGVTGSGYRYGVAPNTGGAFAPANRTIPEFAVAAGDFPSGFEIVVVGPSAARQVFARLVLAAEGSFNGTLTYEQTMLAAARDVW